MRSTPRASLSSNGAQYRTGNEEHVSGVVECDLRGPLRRVIVRPLSTRESDTWTTARKTVMVHIAWQAPRTVRFPEAELARSSPALLQPLKKLRSSTRSGVLWALEASASEVVRPVDDE